ncbi:phosphoribosylglycinamide formyltransferase [Belliella kenyensis]|uniref:Phosphoribosylglycinamide formyltransferase n=1 Tax=Belliella kenyensis TaxID=1472724 RepID=A0ABV8EJB4_9BACT|nr:phosphoribosylglycinamide formyltransferase [Belliella kenyensis]MCH7401029.1 phosphoribosylglycinamide formyltransferase [Belliella kenyensis]MDN3604027.1 phosphoribosylglycinamide formyltransferase [Belliella kenyensis]
MKKIAILASGSGSNAEKIMEHFQFSDKAQIVQIGSNKEDAYVLERAKKYGVPTFTFNKTALEQGTVTEKLIENQVDWVILAGFLLKIPQNLINKFPNNIINIHPALLPKYGGIGMYGMNVHSAVKEAGEKETGITIHLVNENYDEGKIIFQAATSIDEKDSAEEIAQKVHALEHKYFPQIIESML